MTLESALLALALSLPAAYQAPRAPVEPDESRAERVGWIAASAAEAAYSHEAERWPWSAESLAVAALVVTYAESGRWDLGVHRRPWSPDVRGRAACLGQIHSSGPKGLAPHKEWLQLSGDNPGATSMCLHVVVRILSAHAARCRVGRVPTEWQVARIAAAYGFGRCIRNPPRWALSRGRMWSRWMGRLYPVE